MNTTRHVHDRVHTDTGAWSGTHTGLQRRVFTVSIFPHHSLRGRSTPATLHGLAHSDLQAPAPRQVMWCGLGTIRNAHTVATHAGPATRKAAGPALLQLGVPLQDACHDATGAGGGTAEDHGGR